MCNICERMHCTYHDALFSPHAHVELGPLIKNAAWKTSTFCCSCTQGMCIRDARNFELRAVPAEGMVAAFADKISRKSAMD